MRISAPEIFATAERLVFALNRTPVGWEMTGRGIMVDAVMGCGEFSASAVVTSRALAKRSAGLRARQRRITASHAVLKSGAKSRGGRGGSLSRLKADDSGLSAGKGRPPFQLLRRHIRRRSQNTLAGRNRNTFVGRERLQSKPE